MTTPRMRRALKTIAIASVAVLAMAGCSNDNGSAPAADGKVELRFTWWGNDNRHKITQQVIAEYEKANPNVKIKAEFGGGGTTYWDKVSTQVAAKDEPDIIQMDEQYIREYGDRGTLLDLSKYGADTSKFAEGTVETGMIDGKLLAVVNGINAPTVVANEKVFKAAGVELPDDETWTWDDYAEIAAKVSSASPAGTIGTASITSCDFAMSTFLRQQGKSLFTEDGLGFGVDDAKAWFELALKMQQSKAIPSATEVTEQEGLDLDQTAMAVGKAGLDFHVWTNQVGRVQDASGQELTVLRPPTMAGNAKEAQLWLRPSQYFSASARTKHPEEATKFINYLVNSETSIKILGTERGVPANTEARKLLDSQLTPADKKVYEYLDKIQPDLGTPALAPPVGASKFADTLLRYGQEVLFGRLTPQDAAQKMVDELNSEIGS